MISLVLSVCYYFKQYLVVIRSLLGGSSKLDLWISSLMQLWSEPMNRNTVASKCVLLDSIWTERT